LELSHGKEEKSTATTLWRPFPMTLDRVSMETVDGFAVFLFHRDVRHGQMEIDGGWVTLSQAGGEEEMTATSGAPGNQHKNLI
jgi:hypothetical protein